MSLYRYAVRNGLLVREKRKLLRFWMWSFNRSEEDHIITMKNRLNAVEQEKYQLLKMIPEHEKRCKDMKERISEMGGAGPAFRDSWSPRREPKRLNRDVKLPKKKEPKPRQPVTKLATIVAGDGGK